MPYVRWFIDTQARSRFRNRNQPAMAGIGAAEAVVADTSVRGGLIATAPVLLAP